jgi:hypothetical protein
MNDTNRFDLMIESLAELMDKGQVALPPRAPALSTLKSVLAEHPAIPREALFLGLAEDHLPVLLNLYDPIPGPLLITGDRESGKTAALQLIARAAELLHVPAEVQYGVVTQHPDEWDAFHGSKHNAGIWEAQKENTQELLQSLVNWAHQNKGEGQFFLLLVDDLEAITKLDDPAGQNLRWLLLRGASRRVWTFVTLNASRAREMEAWLDFFRTRLFGHVQDENHARDIAGDFAGDTFKELTAAAQFAMREGNDWLKFWLPAI